jgi:hypothetical protein
MPVKQEKCDFIPPLSFALFKMLSFRKRRRKRKLKGLRAEERKSWEIRSQASETRKNNMTKNSISTEKSSYLFLRLMIFLFNRFSSSNGTLKNFRLLSTFCQSYSVIVFRSLALLSHDDFSRFCL